MPEHRLVTFLREKKSQILQLWANEQRAQIAPSLAQPETAILDEMPLFLDELCDYIEKGSQLNFQRSKIIGYHHGEERALLFPNYTLEALLHEHILLRRSIFQVLGDTPISVSEVECVLNFLQQAFASSIQRFVQIENAAKQVNLNRLTFATEAAQIGIWEYDCNSKSIWRTPTHDFIFGFPTMLKSWTIENFDQIMHPDDRHFVHSVLCNPDNPEMQWRIEYRIFWPDNKIRWIEAKGTIAYDDHAAPMKIIGANTDITEKRKLQEELSNFAAMAQVDLEKLRSEREIRERFVTTLTHDLRNPLSAARVNAQFLTTDVGHDQSKKKAAGKIVECLDRTDRMVRDLLDANRITAGQKLPLKIDSVNLNQLLRETITDLSVIYKDRFQLTVEGMIDVFWDGEGIRRVLENLCSNAIKYGLPNRPVSIHARIISDSRVEFTVHNYGIELKINEQESLFEQYTRLKRADKGNQKGWGIGLTLVRGIVSAHGGSVRIESSKFDGTRFIVLLPLDSRMIYGS